MDERADSPLLTQLMAMMLLLLASLSAPRDWWPLLPDEYPGCCPLLSAAIALEKRWLRAHLFLYPVHAYRVEQPFVRVNAGL